MNRKFATLLGPLAVLATTVLAFLLGTRVPRLVYIALVLIGLVLTLRAYRRKRVVDDQAA